MAYPQHPGHGWHAVGAQLMCEIAGGSSWSPMGFADGEAALRRHEAGEGQEDSMLGVG